MQIIGVTLNLVPVVGPLTVAPERRLVESPSAIRKPVPARDRHARIASLAAIQRQSSVSHANHVSAAADT